MSYAVENEWAPNTLELLGRVDAPNLVPSQQPTSLKLLKSADTYQQHGAKFGGTGIYHGYAEYIHALWLESRRSVTRFVPQPFLIYVDHRRYIPDCYILQNNQIDVVELKAGGSMAWPDQDLMTAFFAREHMQFRLIDNDEVLQHETEALHWRPIVQSLVVANHYGLDTRTAESELLQTCARYESCEIGDLISPRRHADPSDHLIALYRLIHKHDLLVDLAYERLDYDTPVTLCI